MSTVTAIAPSYLMLIKRFPLRPIRTRTDYDAAATVLDQLAMRRDATLDEGEREYLDTLELLIEDYDEQHFKPKPDRRTPAQRLRHLMEQTCTTRSELERLLGVSQSLVSLILGGKRELSKANIKRLAERFRVDAGYFL